MTQPKEQHKLVTLQLLDGSTIVGVLIGPHDDQLNTLMESSTIILDTPLVLVDSGPLQYDLGEWMIPSEKTRVRFSTKAIVSYDTVDPAFAAIYRAKAIRIRFMKKHRDTIDEELARFINSSDTDLSTDDCIGFVSELIECNLDNPHFSPKQK